MYTDSVTGVSDIGSRVIILIGILSLEGEMHALAKWFLLIALHTFKVNILNTVQLLVSYYIRHLTFQYLQKARNIVWCRLQWVSDRRSGRILEPGSSFAQKGNFGSQQSRPKEVKEAAFRRHDICPTFYTSRSSKFETANTQNIRTQLHKWEGKFGS